MKNYTIHIKATDKELIAKVRERLAFQHYLVGHPFKTPEFNIPLGDKFITIPAKERIQSYIEPLKIPVASTDVDQEFIHNLGIQLVAANMANTNIEFTDGLQMLINVAVDEIEGIQKMVLMYDDDVVRVDGEKEMLTTIGEMPDSQPLTTLMTHIKDMQFVLKHDDIDVSGTMVMESPFTVSVLDEDDYRRLLTSVLAMGANRLKLTFAEQTIELIPVREYNRCNDVNKD